MASIVKNVVQWASINRGKTPNPVQIPVQADLCETCGLKPKFVDNGYKHPYCSRSCARNGSGVSPVACMLRGCRATGKPAFSNFCSQVHAREGVRLDQVAGCNLCRIQPRAVGTLCITCSRRGASSEPRLQELSSDGKVFKNLKSQFVSEWDSKGNVTSFEKVYEVVLPRDVQARHEKYKSENPHLQEVRSFHSSQCICDLGTKGPVLCDIKSCGICSTVKSSFKCFAFGKGYNSGRFGNGIYSYRNPALANRFATSCTSSPYRVMIACDASVEANDESANDESLFAPIADAIIPVYVIMYST